MDDNKRLLLFFLGCFPVRLLLAYAAWKVCQDPGYVQAQYVLAGITAVFGFGMIYRGYQRDSGKVENQGFAGGEVYWNSYLHGFLYILFAFMLLSNFRQAWFILVVDVFIGLVVVMNHYFNYPSSSAPAV
jgi:hypothetical protein